MSSNSIIDHNNSLAKIQGFLRKVLRQRFLSGYYDNQTITINHEWYFITHGTARRIPDWLTSSAYGLLYSDRAYVSNRYEVLRSFQQSFIIGEPLRFGDGPYAEKILSIWQMGDTDYTTLPQRLAENITLLVTGANVFRDCTYQGFSSTDRSSDNSLDWSWMLRSPGCPLAGS